MGMLRIWAFVLVCGAFALSLPQTARGASSTDNCVGTISALPVTITTPGTWCVTADLSTSIASGFAIGIGSAGVTIDCLDHVLDGTGGGASSSSRGIYASEINYAVVRHCHVRGFGYGISLESFGATVEDNLIENSLLYGLVVTGNMATIRRNRIANTGGSLLSHDARGISSSGSSLIIDNDIVGVDQTPGGPGFNIGIAAGGASGASVIGNRIRGVLAGDTGSYGIVVSGTSTQRASIRGNDVVGDGSVNSIGIVCDSSVARARNNTISGFVTGLNTCSNSSGNVVRP